MKKFIMGFLTAALLFTAIPIGAAIEEFICHRADYKVMVTGTEYINEDLPILNYKGSTYAPFRSILEAAGLDVNWNAELRQAEVTTPEPVQPIVQETQQSAPEPTAQTTEEPPIVESAEEPAQLEYITFVYAGAYDDVSMEVIFPEPMDIATATDVTNYKIYESDKTTLVTFQPTSAFLLSNGRIARINLSSTFGKPALFYVEISPKIKNADGTKFVNVDKVQFAAPGFLRIVKEG